MSAPRDARSLRCALMLLVTLVTVIGLCGAADAACAPSPKGLNVFFVTDRQPLDDAQRFSGQRGIDDKRAAIVTSGILAPSGSSATEQRCGGLAALIPTLRSQFDPKRGRQVLIYVHGYYTSFNEASKDATKIAAGLKFPGPVVLYSWPSKVTSRLAYVNDETNAEWSLTHFADVLASLQKAYPGIRVSFATHSLGSRFALTGLRYIRVSPCSKCFGRAVFFAPDVDSATLYSELGASGLCASSPLSSPTASAPITMYVSNRDLALRQSQGVHGHQRAGQAGNEIILCNGVDTIDVSYRSLADKAGHSYQTDSVILADASSAQAGVSPTSPLRGLKAVDRPGGRYYELHDPVVRKKDGGSEPRAGGRRSDGVGWIAQR